MNADGIGGAAPAPPRDVATLQKELVIAHREEAGARDMLKMTRDIERKLTDTYGQKCSRTRELENELLESVRLSALRP